MRSVAQSPSMRGSALLEEMIQLAAKQGLTVRRESMTRGSGTGGYCVLKGVPTVFVNDRASIDAQIEVLGSVLRRMDWSNVFVHPALRPMLGIQDSDAAAEPKNESGNAGG